MTATGRIPALDGLRGVAILLVLVWHYFQNLLSDDLGPVVALLRRSLALTWSGVDLFFVLSGFLIAGLLLDHKGSDRYFRTFYIRRTCRIFPLYYAHLAVFALLICLGAKELPAFRWLFQNDVIPLWSYATYTQNLFMGWNWTFGPNWMGVTWSLAVEEQFYLVLPLLIWLVPRRALPWILLGLCASAPLLRANVKGIVGFVNSPFRADCLLMGSLIAYWIRTPGFDGSALRFRRGLAALLCILVAGVGWMSFAGRESLGGPLTHLWLALLYTALLLLVLVRSEGIAARALCLPALRWLGTVSYGVYIFHQAVSGVVHGLLRGAAPRIASWSELGVTLLALALTLLLAQASYRSFERKVVAYGHTFRY
jgi:peptidoglycan/LPS O-acetylase OafA/YrhL